MLPTNDRLEEKRVPLYIGVDHVGSAWSSDIAVYASLQIYFDGAFRLILPTAQPACNALLAEWSAALKTAGRLKAWRNELLSVATLPNSTAALQALPLELARLERGAARVLGIMTHAVHLVGVTRNGSIWMQQRALNKATDPGLWDTLSGGLLAAGDNLLQGVLRETHEEAGLLEEDLLNIAACGMVQQSRTVADGHILESVWTYSATLKDNAVPHNLDGEAMGFACLNRSELYALIASGQVTTEAVLALRMAKIL